VKRQCRWDALLSQAASIRCGDQVNSCLYVWRCCLHRHGLWLILFCYGQGAHTEQGGQAVRVQSPAMLLGLLRNLRPIFALPPDADQVPPPILRSCTP